jgi:hypothetical protein
MPFDISFPYKWKAAYPPMRFSLEPKPNFAIIALGHIQVKPRRAATKLPHFLFDEQNL